MSIPTADNFVQMFFRDNNKNQNKIRYAKIDPNYNGVGRPSLIFDGETTPTLKKYMFLSSYLPKPNDRVAVMDNFILGKVGGAYEGEIGGEYAPIEHNHDDRYYTESEVNTLMNGKANTNHSHSEISVPDTRSNVDLPQDFPGRTVSFDFKYNTSVGNPPITASPSYSHIMTFAGWNTSEGSGGWPTQISFGSTGIAIRQATSATTWGPWKAIT